MCNKQTIWTITCIIAFAATLIMNFISTSGALGTKTQKELSDKYNLPITPPGYVFSVWAVIYSWQALWLVYLLYHSIRFSPELKSENALTFGPLFYISWILSCVFNISWLLLFGYEKITLSMIVLFCLAVTLFVNAYRNNKYIYFVSRDSQTFDASRNSVYPNYLVKDKYKIALYTIFLNNGTAFYAAWVLVAACLNFGLFLAFEVENIAFSTASQFALSLLTSIVVSYLCNDLFGSLREMLMCTFSPYLLLLWTLGGILTKPETDLFGNTKLWVQILFGVVCVGFIAKIILSVCCTIKKKRQQQIDAQYVSMEI